MFKVENNTAEFFVIRELIRGRWRFLESEIMRLEAKEPKDKYDAEFTSALLDSLRGEFKQLTPIYEKWSI